MPMNKRSECKKKKLQHKYYKKNIRKYQPSGKYHQYYKKKGMPEEAIEEDDKPCMKCGDRFPWNLR